MTIETGYDVLSELAKASRMTADDKRNKLKSLAGLFLQYAEDNQTKEYRDAHYEFRTAWGMTMNAALDRANPNAIAGFVLGCLADYMKFGDNLSECVGREIAHFHAAQRDGDLCTVRGGKVGKFYPRKYEDCLPPMRDKTSAITSLVEWINREFASDYGRPEYRETFMPFNIGEKPMDEFNPSAIISQAFSLCRTAYEYHATDLDEFDTVEELTGALQALSDHYKLTAKQRVSANASLELAIEGTDELTLNDPTKWDYDDAVPSELIAMVEAADVTDKPALPDTETPLEMDSGVELALNTLLSQATQSKFGDIRQLFKEMRGLEAQAELMSDELEVLKKRKHTAPIAITPAEVEVDGSTLTYRVEMKKASDIFRNPKTGRTIKQLNFDIPTLVWTDADGKEVRHPMCPEIDPDYFFRAKHLLRMCTALVKNLPIWLHGHTGSGKTTGIEQFGAHLGFPVPRINLDSALERADLVGQITLDSQDGTTVSRFEEGILPTVMVQPCFLIMDEIDAGRADLLFVVQRALEGKGLLLTEDGGRLVKPHPLFRFAATANSRGQGDEHGIYAGVRPVNGALLERFKTFIEVEYMKPDEEMNVLAKRHEAVPADVRGNVTEFAKSMRKAFVNGEITVPCSPRSTDSICEMIAFYTDCLDTQTAAIEEAVNSVIVERAPMDNRQRIIEIADKHFAACKFK